MADVPLDHIAVQIYGPRNQLLGHCRIPAALVPQFMEVVAIAKRANPAYTEVDIFRWMVKRGHHGVSVGIHSVIAQGTLPVLSGQ